MKKIKIILNPVAGRGFSAKAESQICQFLKEEGVIFDLVHSERNYHAAELAEQAIYDGFEIVVAAGGDGTTNEVINGLMAAAENGKAVGTLGLFATGSGSDFTYNVGVPSNLQEACHRIAQGKTRIVDLGKITLDNKKTRYFDNQLGIGFDGIVTVEAKKFKRLRGMALYLPVVLKTIFLTNKATKVSIEYDNQKVEMSTMQITIANAAREGGGFFMAPDAKMDDGFFDLCIVNEVSKLTMLRLVPQFIKGNHVNHKATTIIRAQKVTVSSEENLIAHFDGELLCTEGHKIECEIIPQRLSVLC